MTTREDENFGAAFVLASMVATYPDAGFAYNIGLLLDDENLGGGAGADVKNSLQTLRVKLADIIAHPSQLDDLRSEFIDRFDRGRQVSSLYETEYGRERAMVKGNELADIAGFYKAFGFETGGEGVQPEMVDHIAVELEFYALLLFKSSALAEAGDEQGFEIVLDGRRKFLKDHLGRFVGAICERPGVVESAFYLSAFNYCRDLILNECQKLEVVNEPVQWLSGQAENPEMACGGSIGCIK